MNEIKRQLQMKIGDTTQQQRNVMRKINEQYPMRAKKKISFFPAAVGLVLLVATCLFVFSIIGEDELNTSNMNAMSTPITEEQKQQYYQQYVEIVEKAMERKIGISIGVSPMDEFKESDWVEPAEFEKRIQNMVDAHLAKESEIISAVSSTSKQAVTNVDGVTIKETYIYTSDILKKIDVSGHFETKYNTAQNRQLFVTVENISTQLAMAPGTWEQTSYEASLIDNGQKYSIHIEGVFSLNNLEFEKAFTIEFSCDEFGNIY